MSKIYAVSAVITRPASPPDGYDVTIQVPTFYLFADVQGIMSESHARRIAERMLLDINPEANISVQVAETGAAAHPAG